MKKKSHLIIFHVVILILLSSMTITIFKWIPVKKLYNTKEVIYYSKYSMIKATDSEWLSQGALNITTNYETGVKEIDFPDYTVSYQAYHQRDDILGGVTKHKTGTESIYIYLDDSHLKSYELKEEISESYKDIADYVNDFKSISMSVFQTTYAKEELSVKIRIFIYSSLMIICIIFQFSKIRDKKKSMSIRISGVVFLNSSNEELKENVAYSMIESACRFKMGCLLGENISTEIMESYKPELDNQSIAFELMDTPLDSTADQLFGYETNGLNNEDESLNHRLTRIENLFKECFESPVVDKVILDINYLSGYNGSFIEIEVDEFAKVISELYKDKAYIPIARVLIGR